MRAPEGLSRFEVSIVLFLILTVFAVTSSLYGLPVTIGGLHETRIGD